MNERNKQIVAEMIAMVESNCRWDAYTGRYVNSSLEHTITLGAYQFGGGSNEGRDLLRLIKKEYPETWKKYAASVPIVDHIDSQSLDRILEIDWYGRRWSPTKAQKTAIIKLISSPEGILCQQKYFCEMELPEYLKNAEDFGITSQKCQALWVEIEHLGGTKAARRIFGRIREQTVDEVDRALKMDQADHSSENQAGDWLYYKDRHTYCLKVAREKITEDTDAAPELEPGLYLQIGG